MGTFMQDIIFAIFCGRHTGLIFCWAESISALPKIVIGQKVFLLSRNCFCPTETATIEKHMRFARQSCPFHRMC